MYITIINIYDEHARDDKHLNDLDCSSINIGLDHELPRTSCWSCNSL